jgi:alpha-tubulin suppressor-like RCC1 family protein
MGSNVSIGANVQFNNDANPPNITITPKNDLSKDTVYAINYPPGAFTQSGAGGSFVGTAYTFSSVPINNELYTWGDGAYGLLGVNNTPVNRSSPTQVPGINWLNICQGVTNDNSFNMATKSDGTLWMWGNNTNGTLGQNDRTSHSSPIQVGSDTTWNKVTSGAYGAMATKTDGTLWAWGPNGEGVLGQNQGPSQLARTSSPVQIPGTTWTGDIGCGFKHAFAIKTNGTLWSWGRNGFGELGLNNKTEYSSPVQVPGTTWSKLAQGNWYGGAAIKTDGTLWTWGHNDDGQLGHSNTTEYSSPKQVPGTTWTAVERGQKSCISTKTDGTLWMWGSNTTGQLGQNNTTAYSSPKQIPGTSWSTDTDAINMSRDTSAAIKTDGTLWTWGSNSDGVLGQNQAVSVKISSPVQVPGTTWGQVKFVMINTMTAIKEL